MHLSFALLAKAADGPRDLAYIHGAGLDSVHVRDFPALIALAVVAGMQFLPEEVNAPHLFRVDVTDPQGNRKRMHDGMSISVKPHRFRPGRPTSAYSILSLLLRCGGPGEYLFHIVVDDNELTTLSLFVNEPEHQYA
jgi:hypothetical protein